MNIRKLMVWTADLLGAMTGVAAGIAKAMLSEAQNHQRHPQFLLDFVEA